MGFNFPNAPSANQVFTPAGGPTYIFVNGVWQTVSIPAPALPVQATAQMRNRIVNGAMQISQENGDNMSGADLYYGADQFFTQRVTSGAIYTNRTQAVTPSGSKDRYRTGISVADTSLAAGEYFAIRHNIEGGKVADFRYGAASAKQSVLRFGFKAPAGTYGVSLQNSASNRSWLAVFTISAGQANTDTEHLFVVPGDATGTWLKDTGIGFRLTVTLAAGSTFQGVAGWQAGNFLVTSAVTNGLATAGNTFELFDVGLYLDPLNTGVAPPWQMPDEAEELLACLRYWQRFRGILGTAGLAYTGSFLTPMRIVPASSYVADAGTGATLTASDRFCFYQNPGHSLASGATFTFNARM